MTEKGLHDAPFGRPTRTGMSRRFPERPIMWTRLMASALGTLLAVAAPGSVARAATPGQQCAASKIRAAGKKAACLLVLQARNAAGRGLDADKVQVCKDRLSGPDGTFAREEAQGGCMTTLDADTIEMKVDAFVDAIVAAEPTAATCATAGCPPPVAG